MDNAAVPLLGYCLLAPQRSDHDGNSPTECRPDTDRATFQRAHAGRDGHSAGASWLSVWWDCKSERFRRVTLVRRRPCGADHSQFLPSSFDGEGNLLRLGIQAYMLGIAYEFGPYFGLSISRVDPLPHQLEAVYDYLLKARPCPFPACPDDAGAGKTIMAGPS